MHLPINVKSPNNISKWQIGFNSAFKGLSYVFRERSLHTRQLFLAWVVTLCSDNYPLTVFFRLCLTFLISKKIFCKIYSVEYFNLEFSFDKVIDYECSMFMITTSSPSWSPTLDRDASHVNFNCATLCMSVRIMNRSS
jgi:hypothetical protein